MAQFSLYAHKGGTRQCCVVFDVICYVQMTLHLICCMEDTRQWVA